MGTDAIFGPVKASVQVACGQRNDARETMHNFKEGNPVALVARGAYHTARGRHDRGKELGKRGVKHTASIANGVANATPVVGHAKAGYHYARKDKEAGHKAMKSASRSTAGLVGAAAGLTAGLGPGAVAGYMAGVSAADGAISAVDSLVHGEKRLHGNVAAWGEVIEKPSVGNAVEVVIGHGMDFAGGMCVGCGLGEVMGGDAAAAGADMSTVADVGDTSGLDACDGIDGADGGAVEADAPAKAGEDLKFVGDEIKLARHVKKAVLSRFDPGGDGVGSLSTMAEEIAENLPDDWKIPEIDLSAGETPAERFENLRLAPEADLLKLAVLPDNKRDWVQEP